jgi:hypothetical protein
VSPDNNYTASTAPAAISATFGTAMDPASITISTFLVQTNGQTISGSVTFNSANNSAIFLPSAALSCKAMFTCTLTTGAKTVDGKSLPADYVWRFMTDAPPPFRP